MNQKDLTKGPVLQSMLFFALPMIFGNLLQQGYNIADTWLAGNFIGKGALAAVGSAFALMTFLTSVLLGLCMGLDSRVTLMELMFRTQVKGNPFTVTFESLEGLDVAGVWNAAQGRVEF